MANENQIANRQSGLRDAETGQKPCVRASGLTLRRIVLGGCILFWAVVIGVVLL
jgi:hypothetical protein